MTAESTAKLHTQWSTTCSFYTLESTVHFDREEMNRYVAVIRCTDLDRPLPTTGWTEPTDLEVNDYTTRFLQSTYRASVSETAEAVRTL